jgi:hypothetical protein
MGWLLYAVIAGVCALLLLVIVLKRKSQKGVSDADVREHASAFTNPMYSSDVKGDSAPVAASSQVKPAASPVADYEGFEEEAGGVYEIPPPEAPQEVEAFYEGADDELYEGADDINGVEAGFDNDDYLNIDEKADTDAGASVEIASAEDKSHYVSEEQDF